jgi:hypothetical protein
MIIRKGNTKNKLNAVESYSGLQAESLKNQSLIEFQRILIFKDIF